VRLYLKGGGVVLKIVPMGGSNLINGEAQMTPAQIRAEAGSTPQAEPGACSADPALAFSA
jgi:hypothetical protein